MTVESVVRQLIHTQQDSTLLYVARLVDETAAYITQAAVSSIDCIIRDETTGSDSTISLTVADVIFDTLQTSSIPGIWPYGAPGYNFRHAIPETYFPSADRDYSIQHKIVMATGRTIRTTRVSLRPGESIGVS